MIQALITYLLLFSFLISTLYVKKLEKFHLAGKTANSLAFVAIAFAFAGSMSTALFPFAAAGLILCMVGDILLAATPQQAGSNWFFAGVFVFMIAHLVFALGFARLDAFTVYDFIFPVAFVLLVFALSKLPSIDMGSILPVILVYCFLVGLLASKAVSLYLALAVPEALPMMWGAILFCLSDLVLLFVYFSSKEVGLLKFLNLLAYYGGTLLLAISAGLL